VKYGGVLRDDEPVHRIVSDGNIVTVTTSKTIHKARNIIIAAGPWTSQLTDPLDLALPLEVIYASYIKNYFFGSGTDPISLLILFFFLLLFLNGRPCSVKA